MKLLFLSFFGCVLSATPLQNYPTYYMEDDFCPSGIGNYTLDLSKRDVDYGRLQLTRRYGYVAGMDCWLTIKAPPGKGLVIRVNRIEIYLPWSRRCTTDYLRLFITPSKPIGVAMCGYGDDPLERGVHTPEGHLLVHFVSGYMFMRGRLGFDIVFTSYRNGPCNIRLPSNASREFQCDNHVAGSPICIPDELRCNGLDNCGDRSDEWSGGPAKCPSRPLTPGQIMGITFAVLFVTIILLASVFYCYQASHSRKSRRRCVHYNRNRETVTEVTGPEPPPPYTIVTPVITGGFTNAGYVPPPEYTPQTVPMSAVTPVAVPVTASQSSMVTANDITSPVAAVSAVTTNAGNMQTATGGTDQTSKEKEKRAMP